MRLARNVGEQATLHACAGAVVVQKQVHGGRLEQGMGVIGLPVYDLCPLVQRLVHWSREGCDGEQSRGMG